MISPKTARPAMAIVVAALLLLAPSAALADDQAGATDWRNKKVTINFQDTPLQDVIAFFSDVSGMPYVLAGDALAGRKVSARLRNVRVQAVLELICDAAGVDYEVKQADDQFVLVLREAKPKPTTGAGAR